MNTFKAIVDQINQKNDKKLFDDTKIYEIEKILGNFQKLEYVGHGVQSICFKSNKQIVVKCCIKRKQSIITSKKDFISMTEKLVSIGMPILPMDEVIYENSLWMIYTQPICCMIEEITSKFCYSIIKFVKQMIETNIRISDIYYRNFGIYKNKIVMFDYHDIDTFDSSPNFLITNMYSLFTLFGKQKGWNVIDKTPIHWDDIVNDNFGNTRFPPKICEFLLSIHSRDHDVMLSTIDNTLQYFRKYIKQTFQCYPILNMNEDGLISLAYPSEIYDKIFGIIREHKIKTIFDIQSRIKGVGFKLAQDFPDITVTILCTDHKELEDTISIANNGVIHNTSIIYSNYIDVRPGNSDKYDLGLYNSFDELLKFHGITDILRAIRSQIGKYFIAGVRMIDTRHSKHDNCYEILKSPYAFRTHLCNNKIRVNQCMSVDGGNYFVFFCGM